MLVIRLLTGAPVIRESPVTDEAGVASVAADARPARTLPAGVVAVSAVAVQGAHGGAGAGLAAGARIQIPVTVLEKKEAIGIRTVVQ